MDYQQIAEQPSVSRERCHSYARNQVEETGGQILSETGPIKYFLYLLFNRDLLIDGMFMFPPNLYVQCIFNVMIFGGGVYGR